MKQNDIRTETRASANARRVNFQSTQKLHGIVIPSALRDAIFVPERRSPLMHGHINMPGHYTFTLPEDIMKGDFQPLNFNLNNELFP